MHEFEELKRQGLSIRAISQLTGNDRKTIGKYLRQPDDPANANEGFFLAMTHWQNGNKPEARKWFAQSEQWLDQTDSPGNDTKYIKAEAIALLQLDKK